MQKIWKYLQCNRAVAGMEADMKALRDTANLFEVSFPEYKQLRQCRTDMILVKAVWDMVIFVKVHTKRQKSHKLTAVSCLWSYEPVLYNAK